MISSSLASRSGGRFRPLRLLALTVVMFSVAAIAPPAQAATTVGTTSPTPSIGCVGGWLFLSEGMRVPSDGVLTSFTFGQGTGRTDEQVNFKVARSTGTTNSFLIVDQSGTVALPAEGTTVPVRLPVLANDILGFYSTTQISGCARLGGPDWFSRELASDPQPGQTVLLQRRTADATFNMSAQVEPDADGDGFGDETQDNCSTDSNPDQADLDGDGQGDVCDADDDGDGVPDDSDGCPAQAGGAQNGCPMPTDKDQCKKNGWKNYGTTFRNQGDCVSFVATKGKNQPSGG